MMRIGLLGGSFNPPHQGHLHISNLAIKKLALQQVWWIPTKLNPLKDPMIYDSYANRLEKCRIITAKNPKIRVKEFDEVYTIRLLTILRRRYRNAEFFWLMGADSLQNFHQWRDYKKILAMVKLAIFSREKTLLSLHKMRIWHEIAGKKHQIFFTKNVKISSTQIRNAKVEPQ